MLAIGTAERIDLVDFLDQSRPVAAELFGRHFSGGDRRHDVFGSRLFSHAPGLVGTKSRIANGLLVFIWNMNDYPCEPVEGVECLFGPSVI